MRLFTVGAVSALCACGLVIDPDKLVEGNASPVDTPDGGPDMDLDGGSDTGADGAVVVQVPECVPAIPPISGAKGPYAVVRADKGSPIACPPGYLATPIEQGDSEFESGPPECNSASGCSCGSATGTAKCGLRIRYYDDAQCTMEADTPTTFGLFITCPGLDTEPYLKLETTVSGSTCAPSGSATPSAKPAPTYGSTTFVCAPDPNVKTAQCRGEDIALPAAKDAEACIVVPIDASCGGDYRSSRDLSTNGVFTDNRTCACGCTGNAATSCTGGTAKTWPGFFCSGTTTTALIVDECRDRGGHGAAMVESAPAASGAPSCSTRATPAGEASPTWNLKLCCLGNGGG
jgi:hypothetical protein